MPQPYAPHAYQKEAIKFMVSRACAGLFLDPGLGKTSITYAAFKVLRKMGIVQKMLVVSPLRPAHSVWPGEQQKWADFADIRVKVLHGPDKQAALEARDVDVHVINPEGLGWLFRRGQPFPWDMLVIDESTRFKHANTLRFKTIKPVLDRFKRRYILTGSPAPNGLLDLFGQIYVLDLGHSLGAFISHYRAAYFDATGYGGYTWLPRSGSQERIYAKLRPLVLRMSGSDYLPLAPYIPNEVMIELPDKAMRAYKQMEATLLADIESGVVVAANAAAATNKCRQIANGGIYHEGGEKWTHLHEAKIDAVEEIIEELQGKPALVAYEYKHDLNRLESRFPGAPSIGGGVSGKRFREIEAAWNRGDLPVLFAQPQSVAHGLNLQGTGAAVIFHSLTWDLENYEQLIRRVWRQGQAERVVVHHVIAKGTVDEVIMKMIDRKDRTQRDLLDALKGHLRRRPA